jgi:uncharacterized protein YbaR (Trm112 family)
MPIQPDLLAMLCCPSCKGDLVYDPVADTLTCKACRLRFRIENEIPDMLVEHAEKF